LALLDGIKRGFFNQDVLKGEAKKLDAMFKASDGEKTLEEAWRPFHDSFNANDEEVVVGGIMTAFRDNVQRVTPRTLNSIVKLLKDVGKPELAAKALKTYVEKRQDQADFFDLRRVPFGDEIDDLEVRTAFDEKYRAEKRQEPPAQVLLRIAKTDSSSEEDYILLARQTADDFYKLFKGQQAVNLSRIVRTAVGFERIGGDGHERRKQISARAKEALVRIGKESRLNRLRVRKYGIQIE